MKSEDLVQKIRDRLVQSGWRQHNYGGSRGPNCSVGAISFALYGVRPIDLSSNKLNWSITALGKVFGVKNVLNFNDHPDTQFSDIIGLLDQYLCEEQEGL